MLLLTLPLPAGMQASSIAASPQWQATFNQSASLTHTGICSHKILRRIFQMRSLQVSQALETNVLLFPGLSIHHSIHVSKQRGKDVRFCSRLLKMY